jgi:hypothetical protein
MGSGLRIAVAKSLLLHLTGVRVGYGWPERVIL